MGLNINIEKRYVFIFLGIILLGIGSFVVYAVVPNPGHSDSEIESISWSKITSMPTGFLDGVDNVGPTIYSGYVSFASSTLPPGWSSSYSGSEVTITHNLGIQFNVVAIQAEGGSTAGFVTATNVGANSFGLQAYRVNPSFTEHSKPIYFIATPQ